MNNSFDMDFDYTLKIDYENCHVRDLQYILQILYSSSTLCRLDIIEMGAEVICRINEIGTDLYDKQFRTFNKFIQSLYCVMDKLNIIEYRDILYEYVPHKTKQLSPKSPASISPPKIMKKAPKKVSEVIPLVKNSQYGAFKKGGTPRYIKCIKNQFN